MFYQNQVQMNCPCQKPQCFNQVVETYNVEEIPYYTNYHTHVVNNCIKKHINIPTYSTSYENVYYDQFVEAQPLYNQAVYNQPFYNSGLTYQNFPFQNGINQAYQGNIPTNPTQA